MRRGGPDGRIAVAAQIVARSFALLASVLVLGACIADDPAPEAGLDQDEMASTTDSVDTADSANPGAGDSGDGVEVDGEFVEGPCPFTPPPGAEPRCGTVTVPEEWDTGAGSIDLAVAVYPSTAEAPAVDPVVYLDGGPGSHALDSTALGASELLDPLLARGDVIVFDQRGAGRSRPQLACPEIEALTRELEDEPNVPTDEVDARFANALTDCRDRLTSDGIDLGAYTSINNAHDVEAIRIALGYDEWNLLGISYGTRLGLEVMRQHSDGVRAAVLDSVFPPQVDSSLENPATFVASFDAVVAACAEETACAAAGDLGQRLADIAARLEADPIPLAVTNYLTGETDDILVDGDTIVGIVTQALYSPSSFGDLPELVAELEQGQVDAATAYLSQQRTTELLFTDGMFYAIVCNEEIPFADSAAVEAALPADPFGLKDRFDYASNTGTGGFATCEAFASDPEPAIANEPVISDIPALVLAGRFDPVTPVSWSEQAAETLPNSYLVVDPFNAHGVSPGACGMRIVTEFLDDPTTRPDTSCIDDGSVTFLGPVEDTVTIERATIPTAGGGELTIARPAEWVHGGLPGDSYRQASFLDPTQIIQIADSPAQQLGIELYLDRQYGVVLGARQDADVIDGRAWTKRSGAGEATAVEWYETEIDGVPVVIVLVSTVPELDRNIEAVLGPAVEAIELNG